MEIDEQDREQVDNQREEVDARDKIWGSRRGR